MIKVSQKKTMEEEQLSNENGEIVLEATIVMLITIAVVFFMMNMAFAVYNMQIVSANANRAASDVAAVYGNALKDPFYGFMDDDDFEKNKPYRYWSITNHDEQNKEKAKWYTCYNLSKNQFQKPKGNWYDGITVETGKNELNQRTINVHIKLTYDAFTLNPLIVFNFNPEYIVEAEGNAVCIDPMHDMSCYRMYDEIYLKFEKAGKITKIIANIVSTITKIGSLL